MKTIHDDTLIGDILSRFPEAAEIMESYGLHCTDCSVNAFEPIRAGALSHGLKKETVDQLMDDLNELAADDQVKPDEIRLTKAAVRKIKEYAKAEEKPGAPLRITAHDNKGKEPAYAMDFSDPKDDDHRFSFDEQDVLLDEESYQNLKGSRVDYIEGPFGSGFKIDNPNFKKAEGCCGGSGKCGCGTGQGAGGCGTGGCC